MGGVIKAIPQNVVHRICSGQVILDLATAVKELVENSLDAGAKNIEVRLKEYGSELIEVADNGSGVSKDNYDALATKYATSKISGFEDLEGVQTFGFRGEALSSLCALADVSVVTRTAQDEAGTRLEFDHQGRISSREAAARAQGTTVSVRGLFSSLPVRHKELQKNLKRDFAKLVTMLQAYAVASCGVRFVCTNQVGSGARQSVLSTQAGRTPRENLVSVFGAKAAAALIDFDLDLTEALGLGGEGAGEDGAKTARLVGLISKPGDPQGARASGDRQFFYVNGRPVDLPKAARVLNDQFRSLTSPAAATSRPICVLDLRLEAGQCDVNVTPDKRRVFLKGEAALVAALEAGLREAWEPSRYTYRVHGLTGTGPSQGGAGSGAQSGRGKGKEKGDSGAGAAAAAAVAAAAVSLTQAEEEEGEEEEGTQAGRGRTGRAGTSSAAPSAGFGAFARGGTQPATDPKPAAAGGGSIRPRGRGSNAASSPPEPEASPPEEEAEEAVDAEEEEAQPRGREARSTGRRGPRASSPGPSEGEAGAGPSGTPPALEAAGGKRDLAAFALGAAPPKASTARGKGAAGAAAGPSNRSLADFGFLAAGPKEKKTREAPAAEPEPSSPEVLTAGRRGKRARGEAASPVDTNDRDVDPAAEPDADEGAIEVEEPSPRAPPAEPEGEEAPGPSFKRPRRPTVTAAAEEEEDGGAIYVDDEDAGVAALYDAAAPLPYDAAMGEGAAAADGDYVAAALGQPPPPTQPGPCIDEVDDTLSLDWGAVAARVRAAGSAAAELRGAPGEEELSIEGGDAGQAEEEAHLELIFQKSDFASLSIVGQFNLGFIVARLGRDLLIVDQHASHEKATFERLVATTVLNKQPLVAPRRLDLGPAEELIIRENLDIFKANGFDFKDVEPSVEQEEEGVGARAHNPDPPSLPPGLYLTAVPYSKQIVFGPEDVIELVHLLGGGAGAAVRAPMAVGRGAAPEAGVTRSVLRPSRVRAMLASRACRSSIMIGRHLDKATMRRILDGLSGLEAPWNCPHGRPTMRHLVRLPEAYDYGMFAGASVGAEGGGGAGDEGGDPEAPAAEGEGAEAQEEAMG